MAIRRKFVVVDTKGTVPSSGELPCVIDNVRIQHDLDIQGGTERDLAAWSVACVPGDIFKDGFGFVYVCATMWADNGTEWQ